MWESDAQFIDGRGRSAVARDNNACASLRAKLCRDVKCPLANEVLGFGPIGGVGGVSKVGNRGGGGLGAYFARDAKPTDSGIENANGGAGGAGGAGGMGVVHGAMIAENQRRWLAATAAVNVFMPSRSAKQLQASFGAGYGKTTGRKVGQMGQSAKGFHALEFKKVIIEEGSMPARNIPMAKKDGKNKGKIDLEWAVEPAELRMTDIEFMRPTQGAVGYLEVGLKVREIRERAKNPSDLARYLEAKPIPAVLGPDQRMYLVDHHHMGLALTRLSDEWEDSLGGAGLNPYRKCRFNVVGDYSDQLGMSMPEFFKCMEEAGLCHPFGGGGARMAKLPRSLLDLENDPYRSLAGIARKAGAYDKVPGLAYQEFKWADFFRSRIDVALIRRETLPQAVKLAVDWATSPKAKSLPGARLSRKIEDVPSLEQIAARLSKKHGQPDEVSAVNGKNPRVFA